MFELEDSLEEFTGMFNYRSYAEYPEIQQHALHGKPVISRCLVNGAVDYNAFRSEGALSIVNNARNRQIDIRVIGVSRRLGGKYRCPDCSSNWYTTNVTTKIGQHEAIHKSRVVH